MTKEIDSGKVYDGDVTSLADAELCAPDDNDNSPKPGSVGTELWFYQKQHTFNGVPVSPVAQDLPIDSDELLHQALLLERHPQSVVLRISPDDPTGNDRYAALLERQANGEVAIINECKNFDPQTVSFIVWVTYDELVYVLHPRYQFLREK
jgi:hypothetical protein